MLLASSLLKQLVDSVSSRDGKMPVTTGRFGPLVGAIDEGTSSTRFLGSFVVHDVTYSQWYRALRWGVERTLVKSLSTEEGAFRTLIPFWSERNLVFSFPVDKP
uniref:Uncharacterized protein n=1 Tax=Timema poppense TaxID=170557 RepID=A0A7R9DJY7_TIMPO|nr:unnamed protein product [Timema poppensis]